MTKLDYSFLKPTTSQIYAGFEDYSWRRYPYIFSDARSQTLRTQDVCDDPHAPAELHGKLGFIPSCRIWYQQALQAAKSSTIVNGVGPIQFTAPYIDFDTKRVLITISQAFFNQSGPLGVAALDVDIDQLNKVLTQTPVLTNGYMFMVDLNGTLII